MYKLIPLLVILLLNSYAVGGSRTEMLNRANDGEIADASLEEILEAIKNQDRTAIKGMFSEQAQSEYESNYHGRGTIKSRYRYNVYTDKEEYLFSILEFTKDSDNPKNVGMYCLKVFNVKDEEVVFSDAGIYMPGK
jgi:hypothetical protein